ncbi:MAG: GNAT family N-acetyltransferase [Deltaproteobacteria bacterium]|nr:GNAT family N-acetyltransferase [Deltaproteobacteria bacterium]
MPKIKVRRLRKDDAVAVTRIDRAITKMPSRIDFERILGEEIERETDASFVAVINRKVLGFMISYITSGNFGADQCAWIAMFGVDPKYMGQGIGIRLAEEIFEYYKSKGIAKIYTSVRWDSTDILSFFKILGFERSDFINLRKIL